MRILAGNLPVYLCSLRDDAGALLAVFAVVCRPNEAQDKRTSDFSFAHSLLAPALECLRRELIGACDHRGAERHARSSSTAIWTCCCRTARREPGSGGFE